MKTKMMIIFVAVLGFLGVWKRDVFRKERSAEGSVTLSESRRQTTTRENFSSSESRSVDELTAMIEAAEDSWALDEVSDFDRVFLRKEFVKGWSLAEIEAVCRGWMIDEDGWIVLPQLRGNLAVWRHLLWVDALFQSWGALSPEVALAFVADLEKKAIEQSLEEETTFVVFAPHTAVRLRLSAIVLGWSSQEPFAAYQALVSGEVKIPDDQHQNFLEIGNLDRSYPQVIGGVFEYLCRADPKYAVDEFRKSQKDQIQAEMLNGITAGLPSNYDLQSLYQELRGEADNYRGEVVAVLRGKLFSRWLAADAENAMAWYGSPDADWVMSEARNDARNFEDVRLLSTLEQSGQDAFLFERPMTQALRHWFAGSPDQATLWLQNNPRFVIPMVFGSPQYGGSFVFIEYDDLRQVLVSTLSQSEREACLTSPYYGGAHLNELLSGSTPGENLKQLQELRLSQAVEKEVFRKYLQENQDPFVSDSPLDDKGD